MVGDTSNAARPCATIMRVFYADKYDLSDRSQSSTLLASACAHTLPCLPLPPHLYDCVLRHMWHPSLTVACPFCGTRFAPNSANVSMVTTLQRNIEVFGPFPQFYSDPRLRCRCSRCKQTMRLNPFVVENPYRLLKAGVERIVGPGARAAAKRLQRDADAGATHTRNARKGRALRKSKRRGRRERESRSLAAGDRRHAARRGASSVEPPASRPRRVVMAGDVGTGGDGGAGGAGGQLYARTATKRAALRRAGAIPQQLASRKAVTGLGVELPELPHVARGEVGVTARGRPLEGGGMTMRGNAAAGPLLKQRRTTQSFAKLPEVVG